jgi:O-antigen ligase
LIVALAWAPFPLGGALAWAPAVTALMVGFAGALWTASAAFDPAQALSALKIIWLPAALVVAVLLWAVVQSLPIAPASWTHPVWEMASDALGKPLSATISLNPWSTRSQVMQLGSYVMAFWLAFALARRSEMALRLLDAAIAIAALYAAYAFILAAIGEAHAPLIFGIPVMHMKYVTGPFVLHNSFATYAGLATLGAVLRLFDLAGQTVVTKRGLRQALLTSVQFVFGRGVWMLVAALLLFASVVASASRGGFIATVVALASLAVAAFFNGQRSPAQRWTLAGATIAVIVLLALVLSTGDMLGRRLAVVADAGNIDQVRIALWDASVRMIESTPWLGLGLGTFQDAYPMYAEHVYPFTMDRAHNDFLEFAAGVGLPAALAWWFALAWLAGLCLRGTFIRRRNRLYPLLGFGATILVAVHSTVDFSLQLPAVGLLFSLLLGIGVAQSQRTKNS